MSARMSRMSKVVGSAVALTALSASLAVAAAAPASAASTTGVSGARFVWGLSGEQGGGAFFGGCNFLSAGTAGSTGSSRLWTQADGFYKVTSGNVKVEKPDATGKMVAPSWNTKCQDANGAAVNPGSPTSLTGNRVVFGGGTGTVNRAAGTASISWSGSFTSAFYGGLTYWSAATPKLTVANGTGTLTALVSGYGADMNDPSQWVKLPARRITIATFSNVTLGASGFSIAPDYKGVSVTTPEGKTPQTAPTDANAAWWGSFPQQFVDFQQQTGQSSYWFSSGGSRDKAKVASVFAVGYTFTNATT